VYRGTRIRVELIADMLSQGAKPEEILEGYPALHREMVELAPLYGEMENDRLFSLNHCQKVSPTASFRVLWYSDARTWWLSFLAS
jgi:Protein of unknown function (DUF433)